MLVSWLSETQVTFLVKNPAAGGHYFLPDPRLIFPAADSTALDWYQIIPLGERQAGDSSRNESALILSAFENRLRTGLV